MERKKYRVVINTKYDDHGHQVVLCNTFAMELSEEELAIMDEILDTSDHVCTYRFFKDKNPTVP